MSVKLKKEKLQIGDIVCQKYSQTAVECDVIVPDINPDIKNVLEVSGYISVSDKSIRQNKAYIHGCVNITALYAPDGDTISAVKSLSVSQEFNHTVDINNCESGVLAVEAEPESFGYSLINSRKIGLRCTIGINVKLTQQKELEIATCADDDNICVRCDSIRLCCPIINSENRISVKEQLELPSNKPSMAEILKTSVFPQSVELSLIEDKAVANGQLKICTFYISADDGSVQFTEHSVPFNEILDIMGAEEDMNGEIEYSVSDLYSEIRDDTDGEPRIIGIDICLCASVRGIKICEYNIINDAYSTSGDTELVSNNCSVEALMDNTTAQITHKAPISLPEGYPEILQICDICCSAAVERISAENGEITVFGKLKSNVLYISQSEEQPLCSFESTSDFSHTMTVPGANQNTVCDTRIFTEHVSYTLSGSDGIDLRAVLGLSIRSFKNEDILIVNDIKITKPEGDVKKPCITIYFVQHGDSLWSIAKRFKTTVSEIVSCNNLTSETLHTGQQIKICRKAS